MKYSDKVQNTHWKMISCSYAMDVWEICQGLFLQESLVLSVDDMYQQFLMNNVGFCMQTLAEKGSVFKLSLIFFVSTDYLSSGGI